MEIDFMNRFLKVPGGWFRNGSTFPEGRFRFLEIHESICLPGEAAIGNACVIGPGGGVALGEIGCVGGGGDGGG